MFLELLIPPNDGFKYWMYYILLLSFGLLLATFYIYGFAPIFFTILDMSCDAFLGAAFLYITDSCISWSLNRGRKRTTSSESV